MKAKRYAVLVIVVILCFALTGCDSYEEYLEFCKAMRVSVFEYVNSNHARILEDLPQIRQWGEGYSKIYSSREDEGRVFASQYTLSHNIEVEISDESVIDYFSEHPIKSIIYYDSIVEFYMDGTGSLFNATFFGFYYSPQDVPLWIGSKRELSREDERGEFLHYPMLPKGQGWIPDKSQLNEEQAEEMKHYDLYTERIRENFYFYEEHYD